MMAKDSLARTLSMAVLAAIIGLIGARVPSMSEAEPSFSWAGLASGIALVAAAFLMSRVFVGSKTGATAPQGTPVQRLFLNVALVSFLISLTLFVVILYTPWVWPRVLIGVSVICGAFSVFAGVIATILGRRGNHV